MRFLDRSKVPAPASLANYSHRTHSWDKPTPQEVQRGVCKFGGDDKRELRKAIDRLHTQHDDHVDVQRCAYCESTVYKGHCHIEHFRRKRHFPRLTFDWSNLFLSCNGNGQTCCGHYKDREEAPPYNPNDLIKPDVVADDPHKFFFFASNGKVRVQGGSVRAISIAPRRRFACSISTAPGSRAFADRR